MQYNTTGTAIQINTTATGPYSPNEICILQKQPCLNIISYIYVTASVILSLCHSQCSRPLSLMYFGLRFYSCDFELYSVIFEVEPRLVHMSGTHNVNDMWIITKIISTSA